MCASISPKFIFGCGSEVKLLTQNLLSYLAKVFFVGFDNFREFRQHPRFTGVAVYFLPHQPVSWWWNSLTSHCSKELLLAILFNPIGIQKLIQLLFDFIPNWDSTPSDAVPKCSLSYGMKVGNALSFWWTVVDKTWLKSSYATDLLFNLVPFLIFWLWFQCCRVHTVQKSLEDLGTRLDYLPT